MSSAFKLMSLLWITVLFNPAVFSQAAEKSLKNSGKMESTKLQKDNKEAIYFIYDSVFNKKHFEKLKGIISEDYTNPLGGKGAEGFQKPILELINAFPDAQWIVVDIIAEGNKVVVKQRFKGTHKNQFQDIKPTNRAVSVDGITTYELENKKIISSQVQTDRLGFLQQLGVLPTDISAAPGKKEIQEEIYFIDKFSVPRISIMEFKAQMKYNREFIKTLPGYVRGEAFEQYDNEGNLSIITIAAWENSDRLNEAKLAAQAEFKRIGFNPSEFYQRLNIKMERGQYSRLKE